MKITSKIVQIATLAEGQNTTSAVYALTDKGEIYVTLPCEKKGHVWSLCTLEVQDEQLEFQFK